MIDRLLEVVAQATLRRRVARIQAAAPAPPASRRLVGDLTPLKELGFVLPETTVIVFPASGPAQRRTTGSVLVPPVGRRRSSSYVVVNLRPVTVEIALGPARTREGAELDKVVLRLVVQVADPSDRLLDLAGRHRDELDSELLRRLGTEVAKQVRNAVAMHRLAELEQLSLAAVLAQGWLSCTFVDGLVDRRDFRVLDVVWPTFAGTPAAYQLDRV